MDITVTSRRVPLPSDVAQATIPCLEGDPDLWFAEAPLLLAQAQAHCRRCPVRQECLDEALTRAEPWGVWGGEIFRDGTVVPHKRGRGRPRKDPPALDVVCA